MKTLKPSGAPSRWAWTLPVVATAIVAACSSSLSSDISQQTWGFAQVSAAKLASGSYGTAPQLIFFKGRLSSVPNASLVLDSCSDGVYLGGGNNIQGVTYLDAGSPVTTKIGTRLDTLLKNTTATQVTYEKPSGQTIPYTPGDSILVTVPGSIGGFPGMAVRAKTAEAFTIDPVTVPTGTDAVQLRWTPGQDRNGAMILELRYVAASNPAVTRELLCSYADDGVDSIPFRQHQPWSVATSSSREVVATRLRTSFVTVSNAILEVISTFQVPTPTK